MRTTLEVRCCSYRAWLCVAHGHSTCAQANKNDIIRFCVGAVASTTAVGLGILRLVL